MTKGSIQWTAITDKMKVILIGRPGAQHYEAADKLVTWGSRDARAAQQYLDARVKRDAKRFGGKS